MIVLSWPIVRLVQQLHSPYNVRSRHCTGSIEAILHPSSPSYSFPTTQSIIFYAIMGTFSVIILLLLLPWSSEEGTGRILKNTQQCNLVLCSTTGDIAEYEESVYTSHSIFIFKHSSVNDCSTSSAWKFLPSSECMTNRNDEALGGKIESLSMDISNMNFTENSEWMQRKGCLFFPWLAPSVVTTKENDCKYIFMCVVSVWWKNRLDKHVFNGDGRVKIERCWVDWLELLELWREVDRNRRRASCVGDIGG